MRIAWFWASWDVMLAGWQPREMSETVSSLPADAKVHHFVVDDVRRRFQVFYTSETLAEIPEMATIPEVDPVVSVRYPALYP